MEEHNKSKPLFTPKVKVKPLSEQVNENSGNKKVAHTSSQSGGKPSLPNTFKPKTQQTNSGSTFTPKNTSQPTQSQSTFVPKPKLGGNTETQSQASFQPKNTIKQNMGKPSLPQAKTTSHIVKNTNTFVPKVNKTETAGKQEYDHTPSDNKEASSSHFLPNNESLGRIEQKLDWLNRRFGQLTDQENSQEDLLSKLNTYNLYLSKIEQKVNQIERQQSDDSKVSQSLEEVFNNIRTNNLYLAKMEKKVNGILQGQNPSEKFLSNFQEFSQGLKTNNLHLSKLTQKVQGLEYLHAQNQSGDQDEVTNSLRTNNLHLSKLEQKIATLAHQVERQNSSESFSDNLRTNNLYIAKIERKLEQLLYQSGGGGVEQKIKEVMGKIESQKENFSTIEGKLALLQNQSKSDDTPQVLNKLGELIANQQKWQADNNVEAFAEKVQASQREYLTAVEQKLAGIAQNSQQDKQAVIQKIEQLAQQSPAQSDNSGIFTQKLEELQQSIGQVAAQVAQVAQQSQDPKSSQALLQLNENMAHNKQRISEMGQKIEKLLSKPSSQVNDTALENLLDGIINNNRYLSEVEQKLDTFKDDRDKLSLDNLLRGIQGNNLHLSKVEQKMEDLLKHLERIALNSNKY